MIDGNQYQAYSDNHLVGATPMRLIVALYDGAIDAVQVAQRCFETGDIMGRSRAITKATGILTELLFSLDMQKGGEISANLKRLYSYMQQRVLAAHCQKTAEPLVEVENLMKQLLESWKEVAFHQAVSEAGVSDRALETEDYGELIVSNETAHDETLVYSGYFLESSASALGHAYSF